jgi:peptidoglycan-N-acetylglucosamine deacetylase
MIRKYIRYFILISSMSVLMLGFSINPSKAVSKGFNFGNNNITTSSEINQDDLYRKIQTYSEQHEIEPIDAKVDRIQILMNKVQIKVRLSYD